MTVSEQNESKPFEQEERIRQIVEHLYRLAFVISFDQWISRRTTERTLAEVMRSVRISPETTEWELSLYRSFVRNLFRVHDEEKTILQAKVTNFSTVPLESFLTEEDWRRVWRAYYGLELEDKVWIALYSLTSFDDKELAWIGRKRLFLFQRKLSRIQAVLQKEAGASTDRPILAEVFHTVMEQLQVPALEIAPVEAKNTTSFPRLVGKSKWIAGFIALAALLYAGVESNILPVSSLFKTSFYDRNDLDQGIRLAAKQGYSVFPEASVRDKGITLTIHEIMADTERLIATYSLKDENGEFLNPVSLYNVGRFDYEGRSVSMYFGDYHVTLYVRDKHGTLSQVPYGPNDRLRYRVYPHSPYADVEFPFLRKPEGDEIFLVFQLKKVNQTFGDWRLEIPYNLKKSREAVSIQKLDREIRLSGGLLFKLLDITQTPTTSTLRTELQIPVSTPVTIRHADVEYAILDGKGKEVSVYGMMIDDPTLVPINMRTQGNHYRGREHSYNTEHVFPAVNPDTKLFLQLKNLIIYYEMNEKHHIELARLKEKPYEVSVLINKYAIERVEFDPQMKQAVVTGWTTGTASLGDFTFLRSDGTPYAMSFEGVQQLNESPDQRQNFRLAIHEIDGNTDALDMVVTGTTVKYNLYEPAVPLAP